MRAASHAQEKCRGCQLSNKASQYSCLQNELAILEMIHCLVETLDRYFSNVCELDLMFNLEMVSPKHCTAHGVLDISIPGGMQLHPLYQPRTSAVNGVWRALQ